MYEITHHGVRYEHLSRNMLAGSGQECVCPSCRRDLYDPTTGAIIRDKYEVVIAKNAIDGRKNNGPYEPFAPPMGFSGRPRDPARMGPPVVVDITGDQKVGYTIRPVYTSAARARDIAAREELANRLRDEWQERLAASGSRSEDMEANRWYLLRLVELETPGLKFLTDEEKRELEARPAHHAAKARLRTRR